MSLSNFDVSMLPRIAYAWMLALAIVMASAIINVIVTKIENKIKNKRRNGYGNRKN